MQKEIKKSQADIIVCSVRSLSKLLFNEKKMERIQRIKLKLQHFNANNPTK